MDIVHRSHVQQRLHKSQVALRNNTSFHLSNDAIESLKWFALAAMVVDHVNAVFFGRELGMVADAVGRVAFPLFAFVLAYNLARPRADLLRSLSRLVGFGLLAQVPFIVAFGYGWLPLNILFTFAAAVLVVLFARSGHWVVSVLLLVLGGALVEYGWAGVALVTVLVGIFSRGPDVTRGVLLAGVLGSLCWWNGNGWALLAVPVVIASRYWVPTVPRLRRFFWWFYPAHLAVFASVAVALM